MTLQVAFADGYDHYINNMGNTPLGFGSQWISTAGVLMPAHSFITGFRGRGHAVNMSGGSGSFIRPVPSCNKISLHTAIRVEQINTNTACVMQQWLDINNACQFSIYCMPSGQIGFFRGAGVSLLGTTPYGITNGVVHRYNIWADFSNPTSATFNMAIDGDLAKGISLTGVDILNTAQNDVRAATISCSGTGTYQVGFNVSFDDYMFCYGDAVNIGEMELVTQGPISDIQKDWTPSAGTDNYPMVAELPPDLDTTFNSSTVVGNLDLQGFPALPTNPDSIFCITQAIGAKKEESGTRGINPVCKLATEHDGVEQNMTTDHVFYYEHYLQNPETLAAWLASERTAAAFGYKDAI